MFLMNSAVISTFDTGMVLLSIAFSIVGSFVALIAASRIQGPGGKLNRGNIVSAGLALGGVGVWSMHFVGMQALQMDVGSSYSLVETVISLVAAIVGTSLAFAYAAKAPKELSRIMLAGLFLGLGVVVMHYLGMYGLKINGYIQWDYAYVAASVVIAVVAATAALWLGFNSKGLGMRLGAAVIMGAAVCSMHYTGMAAADFICTTEARDAIPQGWGYISRFTLPNLVIVITMLMITMISVDQFYQYTATKFGARKQPTAL
jgi:NO-binding membrane sensor protein with MHYT domain